MALRVASLDYLGTVAARLRKDAVTSKMDQGSIARILKQVCEKSHASWTELGRYISFQMFEIHEDLFNISTTNRKQKKKSSPKDWHVRISFHDCSGI